MMRLIGTFALTLACAASAAAQSAAELAKQEKERREQAEEQSAKKEKDDERKPRSYTNEDLEKAREEAGPLAIGSVAPQTPRHSPAGSQGDEGGGEVAGGASESEWRARFEAARERIREAEARVEQFRKELTVAGQDQNPTAGVLDPNREQNRMAKAAEAREQLGEAEEDADYFRDELRELEEEARRASVPPGWQR